MPDEQPSSQNESQQWMRDSPPGNGWKLGFLILALSPTPVAMLTGTAGVCVQVYNSFQNGQPLSIGAIAFGVFTLVCCLLGGIGLCGGFDVRRLGPVAGGILIGLTLALVDFFVAVFIGCCMGLSLL